MGRLLGVLDGGGRDAEAAEEIAVEERVVEIAAGEHEPRADNEGAVKDEPLGKDLEPPGRLIEVCKDVKTAADAVSDAGGPVIGPLLASILVTLPT